MVITNPVEKRRKLWATLSLINLCITAFLGMSLRTKFLFPIEFINYRYFISAHSHFAFGGWVTLALMFLYVYDVLPQKYSKKKVYQIVRWGTELNALGMAVSFPFAGYAVFSTAFSTLFIFTTYLFAFVFIRDVLRAPVQRTVRALSIAALLCLVLSSEGPWTLAYILVTNSADANLYRDAVYSFLHLQYNGFFTLSIFAVFFHHVLATLNDNARRVVFQFAGLLTASVLPALALALLWHPHAPLIQVSAAIGCILIFLSLIWFIKIRNVIFKAPIFTFPFARTFWIFSVISFLIKMVLQTGTIIPGLGNAVFGYRPIIIGFLHLVFLGLVTFFILCRYIENSFLLVRLGFVRMALIVFSAGIILNEAILMIQGLQLLSGSTLTIYAWLLWIVAIILFIGSVLILIARLQSEKISNADSSKI
jgi:hypothetical protein